MAYREELATDYNFPHIDIYRRYQDDEFCGYNVLAQEGYVFYDTTANDTDLDPETMEEVPVTYYYVRRIITRYYNMDNFSLVAVPRDSVPADMIFGGGNDHVIA